MDEDTHWEIQGRQTTVLHVFVEGYTVDLVMDVLVDSPHPTDCFCVECVSLNLLPFFGQIYIFEGEGGRKHEGVENIKGIFENLS